MKGVAIYMEGGGPGGGKDALRRGMDGFLRSLKQAAREKSCHWKLVLCGSREETYRLFKNAVSRTNPDETLILLVDSETLVTRPPRAHLEGLDAWDLSFTVEANVHLMAQAMETWIVADPDGLARYYGKGFKVGRLPKRRDLEQEPKTSVEKALKEATRSTDKKGKYGKIKHASQLLGLIDPARVQARCPHCKRLFGELERIIASA